MKPRDLHPLEQPHTSIALNEMIGAGHSIVIAKQFTVAEVLDARHWTVEAAKASEHPTRKHSLEPSSDHSIRVGDRAQQAIKFISESLDIHNRTLVEGYGHDWIEDFKITANAITQRFDKRTAQGILLMTTPSLSELVTSNPELAKHHMGYTPAPWQTQLAVQSFKEQYPQGFEKMKSQLTVKHKLDSGSHFSPIELVIKALDNPDALETDAININAGRIRVVKSKQLGPAPRWQGEPVVLTTAEIEKNIMSRTFVHKAYMHQARILQRELAVHNPDQYKPEGFDGLIMHLNAEFIYAATELKKASLQSLDSDATSGKPVRRRHFLSRLRNLKLSGAKA